MLPAMRILFVCMGNICRSPTAEGVMRALVREAGLEDRIEVDSAGTGGWHVGAPPDRRATDAAARRGTELSGAARRFDATRDFDRFDLIVAMDAENRRDLEALAPDDEARAKVRMFLAGDRDVPDPYYGGDDGFEEVLDLVEEAARDLLLELRR
jgi:protein-tyrosine phosphatase